MLNELAYPEGSSARDLWILARRPHRESLDPSRPRAFFVEEEISAARQVVPVATILLTNRECPWRCLMCDLWKNTLTGPTPVGAIPAQIDYALARLGSARQIKLYNSGSFFDPRAIPVADYPAIMERIRHFERVIVENHPALTNEACLRFRDVLAPQLEVAMGLETLHPHVLERLNKRMTVDQFRSAANFLRENSIDLRVFILVQPPFMPPEEAFEWAARSLDFAFDCGATAVTLIPTRAGNGATEELQRHGNFSQPRLETLEAAVRYGLSLERGRVFSDLWDLGRFNWCPGCLDRRAARLHAMNLRQTILDRVGCDLCGGVN